MPEHSNVKYRIPALLNISKTVLGGKTAARSYITISRDLAPSSEHGKTALMPGRSRAAFLLKLTAAIRARARQDHQLALPARRRLMRSTKRPPTTSFGMFASRYACDSLSFSSYPYFPLWSSSPDHGPFLHGIAPKFDEVHLDHRCPSRTANDAHS